MNYIQKLKALNIPIIGKEWLVPADAKKPGDPRREKKNGRKGAE